jgi:hypothetical protein
MRRDFAATFLEALHELRRRQAAREIHEHRHLINETRVNKTLRAITRPDRYNLGERSSTFPIVLPKDVGRNENPNSGLRLLRRASLDCQSITSTLTTGRLNSTLPWDH